MKISRYIVILIFFQLLISCKKEEPKVSTSITALKKIINIDVEPISVKWSYASVYGGDSFGSEDYDLIAIIKIKPSDKIQFYKDCKQKGNINVDALSTTLLKNWFPESVLQCFQKIGPNSMSIEKEVFSIKKFETPYLINGFCFFTDNDEIFIYMYTT